MDRLKFFEFQLKYDFVDPSPDWIVGVSGLELCLDSCTWIEHKELNLYPYDAGTDNGITYLVKKIPLSNDLNSTLPTSYDIIILTKTSSKHFPGPFPAPFGSVRSLPTSKNEKQLPIKKTNYEA